ncbi:MAG: bifunctional 3-(3-hydroxy-phenyl)propionate/3-hydroxycinnamic acid hydroxylase [Actinobacteria bacterium]|nr:bifunctional 3-(3-hydroxy-phenyl)propionate/3-hydroxycinnamic acid hydroxylase [Actinomycetota bacterium]
MRETHHEGVVIGGGPVGMMAGIQLGMLGIDVAIFERWPSRYPDPRACGIHHDAVRVIQSAGLGEAVRPVLEPVIGEDRAYIFRNAAEEILLEIAWNLPGDSGWPEMSTYFQPDLEDLFESKLATLPNVAFHRGWEADAVSQDEDSATVELRATAGDGSGEERWTAVADWVVGADGANSLVRRTMGPTRTDLEFAHDWLVVDTIPHREGDWWPYLEQRCDPTRPTTCVPSGPGGRRRWEFMLLPDETKEELGTPEAAWRLLGGWGITPENADLVRHAVYTFNAGWCDRWRQGRLILAGDAAHLMPPFLGQGLGSGMRDSRALAWRLGLIQAGIAGEELLDSYGPERLGHVRGIIEEAVALGEVICVLDPAAAAARDRAMIAARTDPSSAPPPPPPWRLGPGATLDGDPYAGLLGVQGRVGHGGRTALLDDLIGPGFVLLSPSGDPALHLGEEAAAIWRCLGGASARIAPGAPYDDVDGTYAGWFSRLGIELALVRPDFHVYGTAADVGEADRLVGELARSLHLGRPVRRV